jgi:CYTH domain-containing protein
MYENLEKERRFLIEIPLKWYGKFKVLTADKHKIYQTYLAEEGIENSRVRNTMYYSCGAHKISYTYTRKEFISPGVNREREIYLTQSEYRAKLVLADQSKHIITKTRYYLPFDKLKFELDVFEGRLLGLAILEIELYDMAQIILLPPYLKVIKEITGDKEYANINLAALDFYRTPEQRFPRRID